MTTNQADPLLSVVERAIDDAVSGHLTEQGFDVKLAAEYVIRAIRESGEMVDADEARRYWAEQQRRADDAEAKLASLRAEKAELVAICRDWLDFAKDVQPGCAAGEDWLNWLRSRTTKHTSSDKEDGRHA